MSVWYAQRFRLTKPAIQDIEEIADYIAQQSGFSKIVTFSLLGRKRDEILIDIRTIPLDNYLILYLPIGDDIEILRVVSGYRDLSKLFTELEE